MKKMIGIMMTVVLMAAVLSGCGSSPQQTAGLSGSVSTNGSTSMDKVVGILSEQFMNDNPDVTVTYDATGSGTGIEAVANGTCDIGLASRPLKEGQGPFSDDHCAGRHCHHCQRKLSCGGSECGADRVGFHRQNQ